MVQKQQLPIDKTAYQLVRKDVNLKYYNLLNEYYKITGLPLLINTSFNIHEEPIVCKPEDGLQSLLKSVITILYVKTIYGVKNP